MRPSPILPLRVSGTDSPADPDHADRPRTSWITDPDGYRIELIAEWPTGHADGITKADFPDPTGPRWHASRSTDAVGSLCMTADQ